MAAMMMKMLRVSWKVMLAGDVFVVGCSAGDIDDTRVDICLESTDTESARYLKRSSVSY